MKDDGFIAFIMITLLISAVFFVDPTDFSSSNRSNNETQTSSSRTRSDSRISRPDSSRSDIERQLQDLEDRAENLGEEISEYKEEKNRSKYYDLIQIKRLSTTSSLDASREYVRLSSSRKIEEPINISGWRFLSLRDNDQMTIPQGTELYRPNGQSNISNILIGPDEDIYINSGKSPISTSFKINMCSGYHEQFNDFSPRIPLKCPYPSDDIIGVPDTVANEVCIDFIERMPRCKIQVEEVEQVLGNDCNVYVYQKVNYPTCVETHKNEKDFYENEWRIFLERRYPLWESRKETLQLLDHEGKLVDEYKN